MKLSVSGNDRRSVGLTEGAIGGFGRYRCIVASLKCCKLRRSNFGLLVPVGGGGGVPLFSIRGGCGGVVKGVQIIVRRVGDRLGAFEVLDRHCQGEQGEFNLHVGLVTTLMGQVGFRW